MEALVQDIFIASNEIYGYRRIRACLVKDGRIIAEKAIRRIMKELGLRVKGKKAGKYSSFTREISPAPENLVQRNFHAEKPTGKRLAEHT